MGRDAPRCRCEARRSLFGIRRFILVGRNRPCRVLRVSAGGYCCSRITQADIAPGSSVDVRHPMHAVQKSPNNICRDPRPGVSVRPQNVISACVSEQGFASRATEAAQARTVGQRRNPGQCVRANPGRCGIMIRALLITCLMLLGASPAGPPASRCSTCIAMQLHIHSQADSVRNGCGDFQRENGGLRWSLRPAGTRWPAMLSTAMASRPVAAQRRSARAVAALLFARTLMPNCRELPDQLRRGTSAFWMPLGGE